MQQKNSYAQKSIELHQKLKGKIEVISRVKVDNSEALATAYTPGVAAPCLEIQANPELSYSYTRRANLVAVITDGSAVLGLGNIGGLAGMPVMEGKCVLFKEFGGVDAFPICLSTQDTDEIVNTIANIAPSFGGINLEDISAPRCFEIEKRLIDCLDIPVFHDDQHGTAIVVLAGLINAFKLTNRDKGQARVVINGPGAAGSAIAWLLSDYGINHITLCDRSGILYEGREKMTAHKTALARRFNPDGKKGALSDAIKGADVFIGVSSAGALSAEDVKIMNKNAIIFAMANPIPEIMPDEAKAAGAAVVGTGRSDFANQINNVLVFPGLFCGALRAKATAISLEMKIAAAEAVANILSPSELSFDSVIPKAFDKRVADAVSGAVAQTAISQGLVRKA